MKTNTKAFAIIWLIAATVILFSCQKEDDPITIEPAKTQATQYAKPDTGSYKTYETLTYSIDSLGVKCAEHTQPYTVGEIFVIKSDSTFEFRRNDNLLLGLGSYTFIPSTGEVVIPDNIYAITAPYMSGGISWPGYLETTKLFFKNEKIPYDTTIVVASSGSVLYMNEDRHNIYVDCGRTTYIQTRLKK